MMEDDSQEDDIDISDELTDHLLEMLDVGFDCFCAGQYNPFCLTVNQSGEGSLMDLGDKSNGKDPGIIEDGRNWIAQTEEGQYYILIYRDKIIDENDKEWKVICAECGERYGEAFIVAQRIKKLTSGEFERVGAPEYLDAADNIWPSE